MAKPCILVVTIFAVALGQVLNGTITSDGVLRLSNGTTALVGLTGSGVNKAIAYFLPRPESPETSWINSTFLSYLSLEGAFVVDSSIQLPSLFVLQLSGASITVTASVGTAAIIANGTRYTAITGGASGRGTIDCSGWTNATTPDFRGILALNTAFVQISSLSIVHCGQGGSGSIHVHGVPFTYNAEVGPDVEVSFSANRGVWVETTAGVFVHHSRFHDNVADGIDFDAYTSASYAMSNECFNNARHGIFIEQGANLVVASNNTCYNNSGNGIALYNNLASGALQGNVVIGNYLRDNGAEGASWGSDDNGGNAPAVNNVFAGNVLSGNARGGFGRNGDGKSNVIVGNADTDGLTPGLIAAGPGLVVAFDPMGVEREFIAAA